jgi:alkylation response protein AidB-like acyl-CoA dehydrogenase
MDFSFSSDQELIKQSVRRFLENECPKDKVRELLEDEKGYDPEMWRKMVELGWMGLAVPEAYGGMEGGMLDLLIVCEEMGRNLLPGPFFSTVAVCSFPLLAYGTEEQKAKLLPEIVNGEAIWSLALTEATGTCEASGIELRASSEGDAYVLDGAKVFVPYAKISDYFLVVARTAETVDAGGGITAFIVDAKSPGILAESLPTVAQDQQCEVRFDQVKVPQENVLGEPGRGWEVVEHIIQRAALLKCAEMLGGAQAVLEMTTEYSKERVQFGEIIGSYQAVQHNLVDMSTDIEGLRYLVYQAAWQADSENPAALRISMAKAKANEVYQKVCIDGIRLHGAIGYTEELDLGLYHRCTRAATAAFGDTSFHLERIAAELAPR